jgi:phosphate transport system substrate-binding protein
MKRLITILCAVLFTTSVVAGDNIKIVGSSTVYPFTTVVSEKFGKGSKFGTPIVESTGTGGGMKLFCAGIGANSPSVTNASRAIKDTEKALCKKNGVSWIEIAIGNDGIAFVNSLASAKVDFTSQQLWTALAEHGPKPKMWNEIDPSLPHQPIKIMIPPPTSGTRDAWNDLVMNRGCPPAIKNKDKKLCAKMREDGAAVEAGENDTLIVNKLVADETAYGIMGFSYLIANRDKIQAATIAGKTISLDSIQDYSYPVARPLFVYFKREHLTQVPGLKDFLKTYVSKRAIGPRGYLIDVGLVPLDTKTLNEMLKRAKNQ